MHHDPANAKTRAFRNAALAAVLVALAAEPVAGTPAQPPRHMSSTGPEVMQHAEAASRAIARRHVVTAKPTPKAAATVAATPRPDLRLLVAFTSRGFSAADAPKVGEGLKKYARAINAGVGYLNSFRACVAGATDDTRCSPDASRADFLVTASEGTPGKDKSVTIVLAADSLVDHRPAGRMNVNASPSDIAAAFSAPVIDSQWRGLLGTPTLTDGTVSTQSYSPFLQLVPQTATDRKYFYLLETYLAAQSIKYFESPYTGLDSSGSAASNATGICLNSPRYLIYTVAIAQDSRPLQARTVLFGNGTGQIVDCADPASPLAFHSFKKYTATSTKGSLASIVGILTLSFISKSNSWGNVGAVGNSVAGFVDRDPTAANVEQNIYDDALRDLVDNMCKRLDAYAAARAAANPGLLALPGNTYIADTTAGGAAAAAPATVAFGAGGLGVSAQPPLTCDNGKT